MFERFTDRARRVIVLAQEHARLLDHNYIGTEHILLGLLEEHDGAAAKALEGLDISLAGVRAEVESRIGRGKQHPSGHIPFTPRAKKVLELSLREALDLGHNYIGTEHILLGLISEGEGVAAQILAQQGASLAQVREQVTQVLAEMGQPAAPTPAGREAEDVRLLLQQLLIRLESVDARLAAVEDALGRPRGGPGHGEPGHADWPEPGEGPDHAPGHGAAPDPGDDQEDRPA